MINFARARRAVGCALLVASTAACATVTRGTNEAWSVQTTPPGAAVKTTNGFACNATPCTFKMKRKASFEVTISKDGYKPYHGNVVHQVSGAGGAGMAGNVLIGGLIGAGVDVASGAMMDLKPNPLVVGLEPEPPVQATAVAASAPAPEAMAAPNPRPVAVSSTAPVAKTCGVPAPGGGETKLVPC